MESVAGCLLIALGLLDLIQSVLVPRGGGGLITSRLMRVQTRLLTSLTEASSPRVRSASGPLLVLTTLGCWFGFVWLGLAFVCWPMLGFSVVASSGPTPTSFAAALYHAGFNLTTLGTGDFVPMTDAARLLSVAASATGFAMLTLSLSYISSVYWAVRERCELAVGLNLRTGGSGDGADLLAYWKTTGVDDVIRITDRFVAYRESHEFYPILHGVLLVDPKFAMATIHRVAAEAVALGVDEDLGEPLVEALHVLDSILVRIDREFAFPTAAESE